jgi:CHAT domain-containing protein
LRDYFRDDCVDAFSYTTVELDEISKTAVVIYPILLKDRMEILVTLPTGLKQVTVPVDRETVRQEVVELRKKLVKRTTWEFLPHSQKIYGWLIRPIESDLKTLDIDTLVFVPDGPLRMIPMACLHDGDSFLIEKFALAITPGLDLTEPRPIEREGIQVLALGLTQPVQGFTSLPFVSEEMQALDLIFNCTSLLDREFCLPNLEETLQERQFNIVHIASHGQFGGDLSDTFLLAFDDKVTIDHLSNLIGIFRFRDKPLDLLTLSACETAVGDDRAALGLAGIAVKAGARSALATLWHINDQATSILISDFYEEIKKPFVSRAIALQHAQLKLLEDSRYDHPGYWSPFLLINNWL